MIIPTTPVPLRRLNPSRGWTQQGVGVKGDDQYSTVVSNHVRRNKKDHKVMWINGLLPRPLVVLLGS